MTTNISKQKRDSLISKINEIKKFIGSCSQDENTNNLLTYIAEIEKDIKEETEKLKKIKWTPDMLNE